VTELEEPPFSESNKQHKNSHTLDLSTIEGYHHLSQSQRIAAYLIIHGRHNMLLTGGAGVGKSLLADFTSKAFKKMNVLVRFTSTTGNAALQLPNGTTFHSWLGLGLAKENPRTLAVSAANKKHVKETMFNTECLWIDEVSMFPARLLELLNLLGQQVRKNNRPYGGIQVILSGDFAQSMPIPDKLNQFQRRSDSMEEAAYIEKLEKLEFCFQHPEWDMLVDYTIYLQEVFRQTDRAFVEMLNRIRLGRHTVEDTKKLNSINKFTTPQQEENEDQLMASGSSKTTSTSTSSSSSISSFDDPYNQFIPVDVEHRFSDYVHMYAINDEVDRKNEKEMAKLAHPSTYKQFKFKTQTFKSTPFNKIAFDSWLKDQRDKSLVKPQIELTLGARVMLMVNQSIQDGLVNGSVGIIIDFSYLTNNPIVRFPMYSSGLSAMSSSSTTMAVPDTSQSSSSSSSSSNTSSTFLSPSSSSTSVVPLPTPVHSRMQQLIESTGPVQSIQLNQLNQSNQLHQSVQLTPSTPSVASSCSLSTSKKMAPKYQDVEIPPHKWTFEDEKARVEYERKYGDQDEDSGDREGSNNKKAKKTIIPANKVVPYITYEQVPLKVAYAMSIHKSQGKTLDRATLNARSIFGCGQFYTGLSRVKSLEGLRLFNFNVKCIRAHPTVVKFYDALTHVNKDWVSIFKECIEKYEDSKREHKAMLDLTRILKMRRDKQRGGQASLTSFFF